MANASNIVNLNVKIDDKLKKEATNVLNDLGLNMSSAINVFLTQVVKEQGIPFEISRNPKPSRELRKALKEAEKIAKDPNCPKYETMEEFIKALDN